MITPREYISSHYEKEETKIISYFVPYLSTSLQELSKQVSQYIIEYGNTSTIAPVLSADIAEIAYNFHYRANTLTPKVLLTIEKIRKGNIPLRLAHQTNLFISANIATQLFLLDELSAALDASGHKTSQIYISLDYDIAEDNRFRIAKFPDPFRNDGCFNMAGIVHNADKMKLMKAINKPEKSHIDSILRTIQNIISHNYSVAKKSGYHFNDENRTIMRNFGLFSDYVWEAFELSKSLVDFNAFLLSIIVNRVWNLPTAFLYASEIQKHMMDGYKYLLSRASEIESSIIEAVRLLGDCGIKVKENWIKSINKPPYWVVCGRCQLRMGERYSPLKNDNMYECLKCNTTAQLDKKLFHYGEKYDYEIYPKILFDNLLETISLGICGGTGYIGQAEHLVVSALVGKLMNIPSSPQSLHTSYFRIPRYLELIKSETNLAPSSERQRLESAIRLIETGRASIAYYAMFGDLSSLRNQMSSKTVKG